MPFSQDFERIWKSAVSSINGLLIDRHRESNLVTLDDASRAWERERQNWDDPMRVQNSFLNMLERKNTEYARQFREALDDFAFQEVALSELPSSIPYIAGTAGTGVLGGVIGEMLPDTFFLTKLIGRVPTILAGAVFFAGLGGSVMRGLWKSKTTHANDGAAQKYIAQLNPLHDKLLKICKQADTE